ncbi:MAG: peptidylprolyl isomerase [Bacteroidetes bacterium]|nr:peptidylprolyl isomerase [Bacteroidota bacterium]
MPVQLDSVAIETSLGTITVVLYEETPQHKANFLKLCNEKYYDGLLFHRVIPGFMIQGGDPMSKNAKPGQMLGSGGPNYTIPAEFNSNLKHKRGALAAARTENPAKASSGSQFYICHGSPFELDMNYTVYGQTVSGFEVIDQIANAQRDRFDRPLNDIKIIKTTVKPKQTAESKSQTTASDSTSKAKSAKKSKKGK